MQTPFYQVDVFSDELFGGNPLAVFLRGEDFKETQFQQVAREMNLSETTFVLPSSHSDADFDVRIFTPNKEIPFAGHPTLGTAFVLRHSGRIASTQDQLRLNYPIGVISVEFGEDDKIFMTQPAGKILKTFTDREKVAQALGLNVHDLNTDLPVQSASTGFPALLVPIKSLDAMARIDLDLLLLKELLGEVDMIYPFTRETCEAESTIHARGFAPFVGIPEDPATGSVAGALGYYLNDKNPKEKKIIIEQGYEMKRPGLIFVTADATTVQVGGKTRMVFKASLYLE